MLVIAFWLVIFVIMTHRFSNITLESQRRDDLFTQQPDLSFLRTIDDKGEVSNIA